MTQNTKHFSEHQQNVLEAFDVMNMDVDIMVIYTRVYGDPGQLTTRECQQKLAPTFAEINRKSNDIFIEPGDLKRTYRCSTLKPKV
mgnify:CR=1 FL=1